MVLKRYQGAVLSVKGTDECYGALIGLSDMIKQGTVTQQALNTTGDSMVEAAKSRTPIDTGRLVSRNKIFKVNERHLVVGNDAPYAGFVEYGTKYQRAQPFWTPVIELMAKQFPFILIKGVKAYMDQKFGYGTTANI